MDSVKKALKNQIQPFINQHPMLRRIIFFAAKGPLLNIAGRNFRQVLTQSFKKFDINNLGVDQSKAGDRKCMDAGIRWFLASQKLQPDNGIASQVVFKLGKTVLEGSYPEVTGYIIPTLLDYAETFGGEQVKDAAVKASGFELEVQNKDGSFPGGYVGVYGPPSVFNTAQAAHGLIKAHLALGDDKYLESALRACRWIKSVQGPDGAWGRFNYKEMKRTYDSKVSQVLLEADAASGSAEFRESAEKNLRWVLLNQKENGWFHNCDNSRERNHEPLLHLIGYTIQGLLECFKMTGDDSLLHAAEKSLNALMHKMEVAAGPLPGRWDSNWKPTVTSCCVTGFAQISICWMELYRLKGQYAFLNAALKANDFLKSIQLFCNDERIDGSVPSSYPIWGDYGPYSINSWGVKYFMDALLEEHRIKGELLEDYS